MKYQYFAYMQREAIEKEKPGNVSNIAGIMDKNIRELIKLRHREEKEKTSEESLADKITGFTGSMSFVYVHLVLFGLWIVFNLGFIGLKPVDPSFTSLEIVVSVEAIFLASFVLIRQNRMNQMADKRAHLDLQISLLTEHEVTRLITLVTAIAKKLDIKEASNPDIDELKKEVSPEEVLATIDKHTEDIIDNEEM